MDTPKTEVPVESDIADLIPFFIKSREEDLKNLKSLFAESKFQDMARISHTIKGIARPYGFPSLELYARELEGACKESNTATIQHCMNQVEVYLKNYLFE